MEKGIVRKMTPAHEDERRAIYEFSLNPEVKVFRIFKGNLGNHYHTIKTEEFLIISGKVVLVTENVTTKERKTQLMQDGDAIIISPGISHLFKFNSPAIMVAVEKPYDLEDSIRYEMN